MTLEPRTVLGIDVWYDDMKYRITTSEAWAALPEDGIVEVLVHYSDGRKNTFGGHDFYFYAPHVEGPIYGSTSNTTRKEIKRRYPGAVVKLGKWVPEATLCRVQKEAAEARW